MRKIFVLTALALVSATLSAMPRMKLAARYDYSPDGQLRSVTTPTSDTAAVKTTYKRSYVGRGKVRVSVYRETLENPSFAKFDYAESASSYEVASLGNVARGDNPGRLVSSYVARAGRRLNRVDALGNKTTYKYNRKGQLASTALISGNKESQLAAYKYDNKTGRLAATLDPLGRVTRRLYDRDGRLAGTVNPFGGRTIIKFDKFGRRIARRGAGTYPLTFKYNSFGQMTSYTDDNGNTTAFQYDKNGRLSTRVWPNGSTIKYRYDKKGLLSQKVEADRVTKYKYDEMNRLVRINVGQASSLSTTNLTYSKTGQLLTITNDNSTVEYKYDDFNRVTLEKSENGLVAYEYNPKGLLASKTVSVGKSAFTTTYAYDDLDRLTTVESPAGKYVYQYNKLGRVKSLTMGSAKVAFTYDKAGRLTAKTLVANGKKTVIAVYKYDKLNRRISATVLDTAWKYKYDNKNQLIGALGKELTTKNTNDTKKVVFKYGFDGIGNRLSYSTALSEERYKYNDLNQLVGGYKYDKFGNLVRTPDATYKYNLNNRLVEIRQKDSRLTFAYDGNGRRTDKKVFNSKGELVSRTQFLYSGFKCVAEFNALTGKVSKFYQWQGEQLLGVVDVQSGKLLASLTDGNKNVVALIDNSGEITAEYTYSPFGKLLSAKGADANFCSFGFSSEYRDTESGLVYYNYRYLNTQLGRWMSRDPMGEKGGHNMYAILANNMLNGFDFVGLYKVKMPRINTGKISFVLFWIKIKISGEWNISAKSNVLESSCPTKYPSNVRPYVNLSSLNPGFGLQFEIGAKGNYYNSTVGYKLGFTTSGDNLLEQILNLSTVTGGQQDFSGTAQKWFKELRGNKCVCMTADFTANANVSSGVYTARAIALALVAGALLEPSPAGEIALGAAAASLAAIPPLFKD